MKLTRHHGKWLKRILIPLFILLLFRGLLYYIVAYRFKDIIQLVVTKETRGVYSFNASKIDFSLWKKSIDLQNVSLVCNDTLNTNPHYEISIPDVYLRIQSWTDILFHQSVSADSVSIVEPMITTHEHTIDQAKQVSFRPSKIFDLLQKVGDHLQIRTLSLLNGSFTYSNSLLPSTFSCTNVTLHIRNFSKKSRRAGNLLSSEDIDLLIAKQHWVFPDGIHELSFDQLHFSGRDQYFELDSCTFHTETPDQHSFLTLSAERIRFTSKQLASIYTDDQLLIDTLVCFRPVLHLQTPSATLVKTEKADTSTAITRSLQQAFRNVNFKYLDIHDGAFMIDERNIYKPAYATKKTNLTIYNLGVHPDSSLKVTTDSIHLSLSNIQFYTADSLYQMSIDEFELKNNDVFFKNAYFSPTAHNPGYKDLEFRTPLLLLKNINLEDLIKKELRASSAELYSPAININNRPKSAISADSVRKIAIRSTGKSSNFYKTLHGLGELIAVNNFKIINGNVHYQSTGKVPVVADLKQLNTDILLRRFLSSDSFMNIKRSLPELRAGELAATTPSLQLKLKNYVFRGGSRHNSADEFQLLLKNGTALKGTHLYWEIFDWDLLQNYKIISVESFRAGIFSANLHLPDHSGEKIPAKDLPVIRVNRLDIDSLKLSIEKPGQSNIELTGNNICLDEIRTREKYFDWGNLVMQFNNIHFSNSSVHSSIHAINLDNEHESVLQAASIKLKKNNLDINVAAPVITVEAPIHSTDPSSLPFKLLSLQDPQITVTRREESKAAVSNKTVTPPALQGTTIVIRHGAINYMGLKNKDTLSLQTFLDLHIKGFSTFQDGEKFAQYDSMILNLSDTRLLKKGFDLAIPETSITFEKGIFSRNNSDQLTVQSGIKAAWRAAHLQKTKGDSILLSIKNANGDFEDADFHFSPGTRFRWKHFLGKAGIQDAVIHFRNKNFTADAASLSWEPKPEHLNIKSFAWTPRQNRKEVFKDQVWQADYIVIGGDELNINRIHYQQKDVDTTVHIGRIDVRNLNLLAARDKRIPFRHGIEKPMPTKLIAGVSHPFVIDSLLLQDAAVTVVEISKITNLEGMIPLEKINGLITGITNQAGPMDSLVVLADAKLFNNYIRSFNYHESYADSLSGFRLNFNTSPMILTEYSKVTTPLAAISVKNGNSDTLFAHWVGNKHAAYGRMDFYYNDLQVQILDKQDPNKKSLTLALENTLANSLVLNKNNTKYSTVYFERDKEKFVFNYWVKTSLRGMLSSVGLKSSRKYYKEYLKSKGIYSLPSNED